MAAGSVIAHEPSYMIPALGAFIRHQETAPSSRQILLYRENVSSLSLTLVTEDMFVSSIQCPVDSLELIVRLQGWELKCEKGGIRRVLMNLFGNSLKFTAVRACLHLPRRPYSEAARAVSFMSYCVNLYGLTTCLRTRSSWS